MPRVIVLDPIAQEGLKLLDDAEQIEYEVRTGKCLGAKISAVPIR